MPLCLLISAEEGLTYRRQINAYRRHVRHHIARPFANHQRDSRLCSVRMLTLRAQQTKTNSLAMYKQIHNTGRTIDCNRPYILGKGYNHTLFVWRTIRGLSSTEFSKCRQVHTSESSWISHAAIVRGSVFHWDFNKAVYRPIACVQAWNFANLAHFNERAWYIKYLTPWQPTRRIRH